MTRDLLSADQLVWVHCFTCCLLTFDCNFAAACQWAMSTWTFNGLKVCGGFLGNRTVQDRSNGRMHPSVQMLHVLGNHSHTRLGGISVSGWVWSLLPVSWEQEGTDQREVGVTWGKLYSPFNTVRSFFLFPLKVPSLECDPVALDRVPWRIVFSKQDASSPCASTGPPALSACVFCVRVPLRACVFVRMRPCALTHSVFRLRSGACS